MFGTCGNAKTLHIGLLRTITSMSVKIRTTDVVVNLDYNRQQLIIHVGLHVLQM